MVAVLQDEGPAPAGEALRNRGGFFSDYFVSSLQDEKSLRGLLGEETRDRAYGRLRTLYRRQYQRLGEDSREGQTRRDWLLPLFELLGFHDPVLGRPLPEAEPVEVDGVLMRCSHAYAPEGAAGAMNRAPTESGRPPAEPEKENGADSPACLIDLLAWGQGLDEALPERGRRWTPHRRLLALLDAGDVRWGLLANGEAIRLLRREDAGAGQQYLEFAFEPLLIDGDDTAFAVFWALFRAQAFAASPRPSPAKPERENGGAAGAINRAPTEDGSRLLSPPAGEGPGMRGRGPERGQEDCLLDRVQALSAQRGTRVSTELGESVVEALTALVRGLLDRPENWSEDRLGRYLTAQGDGPARAAVDLAPEGLADVYRQGLVFLFRMLFVLYAESRGVLPVDVPAYAEQYSTERLRERLLLPGGVWHAGGLRVWRTLGAMTRIMREGLPADEFNLPAFDGRLFAADEAPLLECCAVGDDVMREVVLGLTMTRPKKGKLAAQGRDRISYRELGVDQLGAVYEGLLEYGPAAAREPMAVVYEKKTPFVKSLRLSLPQDWGRAGVRAGVPEDVLRYEPGQFYLDPNSGARRGSGTYYTPREFTSTLVDQALGPQVEGKSSDEILALKVLDPAMGSGAFLIAACNYLSERYVEARDRELRGLVAIPGPSPLIPGPSPSRGEGRSSEGERDGGPGSAGVSPARDLSAEPGPSPLIPGPSPAGGEGRSSEENEGGTVGARFIAPAQAQAAPADDDDDAVEFALDREARLARARRLVAERCLYGVDKNPMAVQLARVSLWLTTMAGDRPLTFLDHHLRCGDSLVGTSLGELAEPVPDAALDPEARRRNKRYPMAAQSYLGDEQVAGLLQTLLRHRAEMAGEDESPADVQRKDELLHADLRDPAYQRLKDCLDLRAALWFWPGGAPLDTVRFREAVNALAGLPATLPEAERRTLRQSVREIAAEKRFFHWELEFPELFWSSAGRRLSDAEAGFDAVIGNPPFLGGKKISGALGDDYRLYLLSSYAPAAGLSDECAFFFRRAYGLLRPGCALGMIATNTISQGDTREGGLAVLLNQGGSIAFARRFARWPGTANVEVNLIGVCRGTPLRRPLLDGAPVDAISSRLDTEPDAEPQHLRQNADRSFIGSYVLGLGFVLEPEEAEALIAKDRRNREVLSPYLNGEDLNSRPDQSSSRWVINFRDWPLARAEQYADCMAIVREKVKPERDKLGAKGDASARGYARSWWQYARRAVDLYAAIATYDRVLLRPQTSENHMPVFVPNGFVYDHALVVFAFDDDFHFALLQSNVHEAWVRRNASTMRTDIRYTPSDCFETFPFPQPEAQAQAWADAIGGEYHEHRRQIMLGRWIGLTDTYNLFNNPSCKDDDIVRLRALHAELDAAVLACYGWQDLEPAHGFYPNERGKLRFTIAPDARRDLLRRLLALNLERAAASPRPSPAKPERAADGGDGAGD